MPPECVCAQCERAYCDDCATEEASGKRLCGHCAWDNERAREAELAARTYHHMARGFSRPVVFED
jgi:hypothetical protein